MPEIRGASLDAHAAAREASLGSHAAAREAIENNAACYAARAAGQAVATAHVPQHAFGGAYYALKAVAAADPENAGISAASEYDWQSRRLPEHLRQEIMRRIIIRKQRGGVSIKIQKDEDF